MKQVFYFLLFFSCFFQIKLVFSQNKDIEWLREINIERNKNLDPTIQFFDKSMMPVIVVAPITVLGIGLLKKDSIIKRKGLFMAATFCVNSALTLGMKWAINRPRPYVTYPEIIKLSEGGSYSFPSGHTSSAFSTATSLTIAFPKWYVAAPSFLWASVVGYGRMHLGVHYPSDVLVGALVGSGSALMCQWLNNKINWERKKKWFW